MNNLYWSIFKNLEKEVVSLSNEIHFDDDQLDIYSIKITELLIRTVVEIESISKELYFNNGGTKADNNELFFDTDCLNHLENKWLLSKKKVLISSPNFYFKLEENQILTPLKKANKRGSSSTDYLKAYQAVKHNRAKNLKKGNLRNLIRALTGLYILNLYFNDNTYHIEKDGTGTNFDQNVGSEIFSVKIHPSKSININDEYHKNDDYEECIYLIVPTEETRKIAQKALKDLNKKTQERYSSNIENEIKKKFAEINMTSETDLKAEVQKIAKNFESENMIQVSRENGRELQKSFEGIRYDAELNKNQF